MSHRTSHRPKRAKIGRWIAIVALTPGWLIPRVVGTLAFLTAPSWSGFVMLVTWWTLIPLLWWIAFKTRRYWIRYIPERLRRA